MIVHVTVPVGATALAEPVTVAVKVTVPPRVGVPDEATLIVGVAAATAVELDEETAATA